MDLLIKNIKTLYGIREQSVRKVAGKEMKILPSIDNAFLLIKNGKIAEFGSMDQYTQPSVLSPQYAVIDSASKSVLPCFCDSHTHIVYAGSRAGEFADRINGLSYEEIANRGGGILNSAALLDKTSEEELYESAWQRLNEIISMGTGAIEIKSGYGLSVEGELKMLRVIRKLKENSPIPVKANFLAAHAFPMVFKNDHAGYIKLIIDQMLPQIANENLSDYIDVFCERGFFSGEETDSILKAGAKYGLKGKIHANQLSHSGGIKAGVENNALSVDHLEFVSDEDIELLRNSETMPTLLPSAAFFLGLDYQPARKIIDSGLPAALASDYNPGSSPSGRMSFVVSLACIKLKMTPEEAVNASTINSAYAMGVENELGSISPGKKANLIITKEIPALAYLPYSFGSDLIDKVIINGSPYRK